MSLRYPKLLRQLRTEAHKSQAELAEVLGTSQTMYARYERGANELPLRHLLVLADYYGVSCDYLLGRAADKSGTMIAVEEIPEQDPSIQDKRMQAGGVLPTLNKKLLVNSLQVIFDLLQKSRSKALTAEVSNCLIQTVYMLFREIYSADPRNPKAMFSVDGYLYRAAAFSSAMQSVARTGELAREAADELPATLPDALTAQYPMFANSLLNLLHQAEKTLGSP